MTVVLIATIAIVLGTWLGAPTLSAILVGLVVGFGWPLHAARRAALAGILAWGGVLVAAAMRGDTIVAFGNSLGGAMGVPGWVIVFATLLYPAMLASSAAWLAHLVSARRSTTIDPGAIPGGGHPNT